MKMALRVAALFAVYGSIGYGGDYAASLLGNDAQDVPVEVDVQPMIATDVVVDVKPTIVTRVQVRHAGQCAYDVDREFTLPIQNIRGLELDHGSGDLHVEGRDDLNEIVVSARVCASHEEYVEEMDVVVRTDDALLRIEAVYPQERNRRGGRNTARIDMTVLIPTGLDVEIDDSSGDIVVSGTGDLNIDDSSGSIDATDIRGSLSIDDSSGDVDVQDIRGDVSVDDSSGSLDITGVAGAVFVRDGSGGIEITDVERNVLIEADGSGGIDVRNVGGDFAVERDGSGGIRHSGVDGRVDIPRKR